ncbi:MAG: hypothetical protein ACT4P7_13250 [Gemmatimonadaceae bacterium]
MTHSVTRLAVGGTWLLIACSDLTNVENPAIVAPAALDNPVGAVAQYAGATRLFVNAAQTAIHYTAMFSDEWILSDAPGNSFNTPLDKRAPQTLNHQTGGNFTIYSGALRALTLANEALRTYATTPSSRMGQMLAYKGYLELFLGEQFCNGIPFSTMNVNGKVVYGGPTNTTDVYLRAIAHFDSAIAVSADSARVLNFARVGRARALLGLGRFADAAAAVAAVPTTFTYNLEILGSLAGQQNTVFNLMNTRAQGVGGGSDGGNGINWLAAADPRVPLSTAGTGIGTDGSTRVYMFAKYNSLGSPITFASGIEARFYGAEAALQANRNDAATTGTGWLGILNTLRATAITPAMTPLADPGSFDARVDLLFREKAFWTFLTAKRMADLRRLVRQYGRTEDKVFPSGTYKDGNRYGSDVNLELPITELPNANYKGCIDRKA